MTKSASLVRITQRHYLFICILLIYTPSSLLAQSTEDVPSRIISPNLHSHLQNPASDSIWVEIVVTNHNVIQTLNERLLLTTATYRQSGADHIFICKISKSQLDSISTLPGIKFIDLVRKPHTEFKQEGLDLTLNEVRYLQHNFPELIGTGMNISIKENLFDTTDIDFKNRIIALELASSHIDMHATNMASIAAGGGNSSPTAKGVAWAAELSSSDFSNLYHDDEEYFIANEISVQNHAYGTGIENYYGPETSSYDRVTQTLPWVMHVFSAGNIGDQTPSEGKYAGLQGWANLTGQFKQSKNTITVGATDSLNNVVPLSSRGPAYDGRIKPDVVAYGHGGSSGSAAIVSGIALLIQEAYSNKYETLPPSSLIKAALVNTATDIENPGPDYKSGFGSVNADRAVRTILEDNFREVMVEDNDIIEIPLTIPSNTANVSLTIAWIEPPPAILAQKAVRHKIDFELENISNGEVWLPWILNAAANSDSLGMLAKRGVDTLNNIEKITLNMPSPGEYIIRIHVDNIVTSEQLVSVVWEVVDLDKFDWALPTQDDHLVPGSKNIIRWRSMTQETGDISYRYIGGDWNVLTQNASPSTSCFIWDVPDIPGLAQLRWSSSTREVYSDTFIVSTPPEPYVALLCADSLIIQWNDPGQSDSFEIFRLGERHLEHYQFVHDTFFVDYNADELNPYYAVAPYYGEIRGPLSYAFDYTEQGGGCFLENFYLRHVLDDKANFGANLSVIEEIDSVIFEEKINGVFLPVQSFSQIDSTVLFFSSNPLRQGINDFRLRIILFDGREIISQEERVYFNKNNAVLLFPNPIRAGEELTLLIKDIDEFDIVILDMQGKEIFRFSELESPVMLPPLNLVPGIYIYKIASPQGDVHGKIQVY